MGIFDNTIKEAKAQLAKAFNDTFNTIKGFSTTVSGIRNSALESTPELVETATQGVQISTDFLARHVDLELVEAAAGKYLGINDDAQQFSTEESLQDDEIDNSFTEENPYHCMPICSRIIITYWQIVTWFHLNNFIDYFINALRTSQGNSYVKVGFWGQFRKANRLAQDEKLGKRISVGWLQWLINRAAGQVKGITLVGGDEAWDTGADPYPDGSYPPVVRLDRRDYTIDPINIGTETGSKGTGTGYLLNGAALLGATSIPVDTGAGTVPVGDEVMFAGDDTRYTVTTGITGPGTLVITPGLKVAADDATEMTIVTETVADYVNLDIPVLDAIQSLISPQFHENLRCIVGIGIYNYLTKRAITLVTGAANPIMDFNALPEYSANLNIAGYPVVLDKTAPANMIFITRTKQADPSFAMRALAAASGVFNNPLLSNSNIVLIRHIKVFNAMMDMVFKSKIVYFTWEALFYGLRHHKSAVLFHPDAVRFFNGTSYKSAAVQWQLTQYDEAIAD